MSMGLEFEGGAVGAAAALALAAGLVWHCRRARAGKALLALRVLAVSAVACSLLRPAVTVSGQRLAKPPLLVLLDAGHAMAARKDAGGRLEAARDWLLRRRQAIDERCAPRFFALSDRGRGFSGWEELSSLTASSAGLHPSASLRDVADDLAARRERPQRAWLLSDGNAEPDPDLDAALAELRLPVDVVGVGPSRRERGAAIVDLRTPDFAFLHGRVAVAVDLEASALAGQALELTLSKRGPQAASGWEVADRRRIEVRSDLETVAATFTATAQSLGTERYRVEARAAGVQVAAREFRVEVIRQKYRIMYLSGRPSAEYANLREFLKSDPNHELVSFVILRNPENPSLVPEDELSLIPFPASEIFVDTLPQFDLFILENFSYARFHLPTAYLASLKSFVAAGGALLVIGGENAFALGGYQGTPLEDVLPVTLSDRSPDFVPGLFRAKPAAPEHPLVRLYDTAERSRAAWEALPELDGYARFASVRPGASVLAVHPEARTGAGQAMPLFAVREYGRGKVMLVSTDSTWRWRLGAALDWRTADFYGRFWTRAVEYLTGSLELSKVKFAPLPDRLPAREPAVFSLRVFDENFQPAAEDATALSVLWTAPGGQAREVSPRLIGPGSYSVELTGLAPGWHRLRALARLRGKPWGEDEVRFAWAKAPPAAPMDLRWLRHAAQATGGSFTELSGLEARALLDKLPPVARQSEVTSRRRPTASLWWLAAALALLLSEWAWRRWRGQP